VFGRSTQGGLGKLPVPQQFSGPGGELFSVEAIDGRMRLGNLVNNGLIPGPIQLPLN
jgi:hypothetical protein